MLPGRFRGGPCGILISCRSPWTARSVEASQRSAGRGLPIQTVEGGRDAQPRNDLGGLSRRTFLRAGTLGTLGLTLGDTLALRGLASESSPRRVR